jgi:hypothetical protein
VGALDKPISEIDAADVEQLCIEQRAEGAQFEIKQDLPSQDGKVGASPGTVGDYARNTLTTEIVACANTYGGTMVLGIAETSDKPNRARSVSPLPQCCELATRLRHWGEREGLRDESRRVCLSQKKFLPEHICASQRTSALEIDPPLPPTRPRDPSF